MPNRPVFGRYNNHAVDTLKKIYNLPLAWYVQALVDINVQIPKILYFIRIK